jgi:hypothetical protein
MSQEPVSTVLNFEESYVQKIASFIEGLKKTGLIGPLWEKIYEVMQNRKLIDEKTAPEDKTSEIFYGDKRVSAKTVLGSLLGFEIDKMTRNSKSSDYVYVGFVVLSLYASANSQDERNNYRNLLSQLLKLGNMNLKELFCASMDEHWRVDSGSEDIFNLRTIALFLSFGIDINYECPQGDGLFALFYKDSHMLKNLMDVGLNVKEVNLCLIESREARVLLEEAGFRSFACSGKSWSDYLDTYIGFSHEMQENLKVGFVSGAVFGFLSEFLAKSHFSRSAISLSQLFLQAVVMYGSGNYLSTSVGLATTVAFKKFGILSDQNASWAGMWVSQGINLVNAESGYVSASLNMLSAAAGSKLGDYCSRSLVRLGFWYGRDKKEYERRIGEFESSLRSTSVGEENKKTLSKELPHYLGKKLECVVSFDIPLVPVVAPSGNLLDLDDAKKVLGARNYSPTFTWDTKRKIEVTDFRSAIQLIQLLNNLGQMLRERKEEMHVKVLEQMCCSKTKRNLSDIKEDEAIFITKEGLFIIGKKVRSEANKDITDEHGNYFVPNMQRDFFVQINNVLTMNSDLSRRPGHQPST